MLLTDLPFPVVIVAPTAWASYFQKADDVRAWNSVAIRKYSRDRFIVADANGGIWNLLELIPTEVVSFFDRFRLQPRPIPTLVHLEAVEGPPLETFQERLRHALEHDCCLMTQFKSKEEILKWIETAESVESLTAKLHKMQVI
nr:hypothetical protein [uncultured Duganella sp.]